MAITSKEYRDYTVAELEDKLRQLREELFKLRFQSKVSKLDKPHKIKLTKRDIARIKTFLRQNELKNPVSSSVQLKAKQQEPQPVAKADEKKKTKGE